MSGGVERQIYVVSSAELTSLDIRLVRHGRSEGAEGFDR